MGGFALLGMGTVFTYWGKGAAATPLSVVRPGSALGWGDRLLAGILPVLGMMGGPGFEAGRCKALCCGSLAAGRVRICG